VTDARMTYAHLERQRLEFAEKAAKHFADNPKHFTYTEGGDITSGCLLAIRWGLGNDCVLVVKLDEQELPVNFQNIIDGDIPF
jgi:hypothetical protein